MINAINASLHRQFLNKNAEVYCILDELMQYVSADSFVADLVELYLEFPEVRKLKTTDALIFTFELGQHFKQLKIFMKSAAFLRAQRLEKEFVTKFTDYMNICRKLIYGD